MLATQTSHIGFRQSLLQGQDATTTELGLQVLQRLLTTGDQEQFTDTCTHRQPAADSTADISGGTHHGNLGSGL